MNRGIFYYFQLGYKNSICWLAGKGYNEHLLCEVNTLLLRALSDV